MAEIIRMPKMSDTMEEGVISSWLVKEGDEISSGDVLAEVETDKATMELESYWDGKLLYIGIKEGDAVPVDGIIAVVGEEGEDVEKILKSTENGDGGDSGEKESDSKDTDSKDADSKESDTKEEKSESSDGEEIDTSDINATVVTMPKMSDTMTEGTVESWLVKVGDMVESGDVLAEIETDKATMELESYFDGELLYIGPEKGSAIEVDGILAVIGEKGADYKSLIKEHKAKSSDSADDSKKSKSDEKTDKPAADDEKSASTKSTQKQTKKGESGDSEGRIFVSPLARNMAEDKGYDLSKIQGSGDNGRIVKRDIESYEPSEEPASTAATSTSVQLPSVVGEEKYEDLNLSQMRKTIAKRLSESKFSAPHFYLTMEINMDKAIEARKSLNETSEIKISFNDLVIKAAASALRKHLDVNVSWLGDKIRKNEHINIGVAVAIPEGLIVPVVRFADNKSLSHISAEVKDLAGKAADKKLQPADWEGSTFTISNLGMFGIEEFTAIINPPDACILAVGGIKQTGIIKDGEVVPGNVMKVTMSCDHRAVDGATGAAFLKTLKETLEDPIRILL